LSWASRLADQEWPAQRRDRRDQRKRRFDRQAIERSEIGTPGEFDHLNDTELLQAPRERLSALGLSPILERYAALKDANKRGSLIQLFARDRLIWQHEREPKRGGN
jgi:hypothetical protein